MLEIQETETEVVKQMFNWCYQERLSCLQIAERLNALSIPTHYYKDDRPIKRKGKREPEKTAGIWRAGRVLNMLKIPAYYGEWEWGKRSTKRKSSDRISGYCLPIITQDVFLQVGEIIRSKRLYFPDKGHRQNLLQGVIKCDVCRRTFYGTVSRVGPARSWVETYYKCGGHTHWRKLGVTMCPSPSLDAKAIEDLVWEDIKAFCENPAIAMEQLRSQRLPFTDTLEEKITDKVNQVTEVKRQEINLLKIAAVSQEVSPDSLDAVLRENRKTLETLVQSRNILESEKNKG